MSYKIPSVVLITGLMITGLSGCASLTGDTAPPALNAQQSSTVLTQADDCCQSLAALPYQSLGYDQTLTLNFDASTPAHVFDSGKSLFHAFSLPRGVGPLTINVTSPVHQQQVFAPELLVLDVNFQPVRRYADETFSYAQQRGFSGDRLSGELTLTPGDDAAYLIVMTSDKARAATTTMLHPAKAYARARSLVEPDIEDPVAQHVATGQVTLDVSPLGQSSGLVTTIMGRSNSSAPAVAQPTLPQTQTTQAANQQLAPAPQAQTAEAAAQDDLDYHRMINAALKAGDIELAIELADRAERAGQTGTRAWLAKQLKARTP
ncbi:MalM family protein [Phytohalomonas tamaricis]|uniref:MalM family protein n=1 Tax=Phytohalomonas tamaricis TaxID=2081032 RepID=UPI000D0B4266|nr:MalM family protein [Phytohalomonas tamaricis]